MDGWGQDGWIFFFFLSHATCSHLEGLEPTMKITNFRSSRKHALRWVCRYFLGRSWGGSNMNLDMMFYLFSYTVITLFLYMHFYLIQYVYCMFHFYLFSVYIYIYVCVCVFVLFLVAASSSSIFSLKGAISGDVRPFPRGCKIAGIVWSFFFGEVVLNLLMAAATYCSLRVIREPWLDPSQ